MISFIQLTAPKILGYASQIPPETVIELTNQERAKHELPSLELDARLSDAARRKAADMFNQNYWAHNAPNGTKPWSFIIAAGYNYLHAGENLARDFTNPNSVVSAWMASSSHKDNILNPRYRNIGIAVVDGQLNGIETTLVVQMFGTPPSSNPQLGSATSVIPPVLAQEQPPPKPTPLVTPSPTPTPISTSIKLVQEPVLNTFTLTKAVSIAFALLILIVLAIDWLVAWKKNLVRLSGKNWAHITYILITIILAIVIKQGLII